MLEATCQGRRHGFNPWPGKIPLEEEMAIHSSTLVWEIPDKVAWQAKESMESQKSQTQLSNLTIVYIYICIPFLWRTLIQTTVLWSFVFYRFEKTSILPLLWGIWTFVFLKETISVYYHLICRSRVEGFYWIYLHKYDLISSMLQSYPVDKCKLNHVYI